MNRSDGSPATLPDRDASAQPSRTGAKEGHTPSGAAYTLLVLELFRLHGRTLAAGERLTSEFDLTAARWQVLGAIKDNPLTVAQIARNMGLQRQSVQRTVDLLEVERLVELIVNPHHRRAKLVRLTTSGRTKFAQLSRRQIGWANRVSEGISPRSLKAALSVVRQLRINLENDE